MQACGHMYLDEGEELSTGAARDNLLAFSAYTVAGGNGTGQVSNFPAVLPFPKKPCTLPCEVSGMASLAWLSQWARGCL